MEMDLLGILFLFMFYALITITGLLMTKIGSWKNLANMRLDSDQGENKSEKEKARQFISANNQMGLCLGICTLVATQVGGAFVNGTCEEVFKSGLLWCLAPIGYSLSLTINGFFFASKIRESNCITVIDILQRAYGNVIGGLVYLPSCIGDVCWTAAILSALGTTLQVMLGVDKIYTIFVSSVVVISYTMFGGISSVAHTDVLQLLLTFLGLILALPFVLSNSKHEFHWDQLELRDLTGTIEMTSVANYVDTFLLIVLGGLPWQPYYQRALAMKDENQVKLLSLTATILSLSCMISPALIGLAAKTNPNLNLTKDTSLALPQTISETCPYSISLLSLAAISAATMSSMDSSLLGGASYLSHNLYRQIFKPKNDAHMIVVLRSSVFLLGFLAFCLSASTETIYGLWVLAGDLGYVMVFPQFLAAVHFREHVNACGSVAAAFCSVFMRLSVGEEMIGLKNWISIPRYHENENEIIPIKTMIMMTTLVILIIASKISLKLKARRYQL